MQCPNCEGWHDAALAYKPFDRPKKFLKLLNMVVKCPKCKHVFSPVWTNED